jgi:hypothetical protein
VSIKGGLLAEGLKKDVIYSPKAFLKKRTFFKK